MNHSCLNKLISSWSGCVSAIAKIQIDSTLFRYSNEWLTQIMNCICTCEVHSTFDLNISESSRYRAEESKNWLIEIGCGCWKKWWRMWRMTKEMNGLFRKHFEKERLSFEGAILSSVTFDLRKKHFIVTISILSRNAIVVIEWCEWTCHLLAVLLLTLVRLHYWLR